MTVAFLRRVQIFLLTYLLISCMAYALNVVCILRYMPVLCLDRPILPLYAISRATDVCVHIPGKCEIGYILNLFVYSSGIKLVLKFVVCT